MIAPLEWLSEFVKLPEDLNLIESALCDLGFEVENINQDYVEIEVTPNRADMLSIIGFARELAIKFPNDNEIKTAPKLAYKPKSKLIDIKIDEEKEVINFGGLVIKDVKITNSPKYIIDRLIKSGLNPINNFVDLTNYLMLETGQPLHSFDLDTINDILLLRKSRNNEKIKLLDGKSVQLEEGLLIYESNGSIVDLIGIMGGENSSTTKNTKNIFIQAATFKPDIIRFASKITKTSTPASYRYERGVDDQQTLNTIAKFKTIVEKNKWGSVKEVFYKKNNPSKKRSIEFDCKKISKLIGTHFEESFCINALKSTGCIVKNNIAIPPGHRQDITIWQDLAEEISRLYGYNNLTIELIDKTENVPNNKQYWEKYYLKLSLIENGFSEVSTYSFLSDNETKIIEKGQDKLIKINNPLSSEHNSLRNSLIPLLIKTASKNPWYSNIKLFEIGNIFSKDSEIEHLALLSHQKLNIAGEIKISPDDKRFSIFKIRKPLYVFECELKEAYKMFKLNKIETDEFTLKPLKFKNFSKQHPTVMDVSVVVDKNINFEKIRSYLQKQLTDVFDIDLFDQFENKNFGENKISYAFHLIFDIQNIDKINDLYQKTLVILRNNFKATIR